MGNLDHVLLLEAAGGDSRCADAQAAGDKGALRVVRDGVLVGGDVDSVQTLLQILAGDVHVLQVDQDQVVVGAAGYQAEAFIGQRLGKGLRVFDDLLLIGLEFRFESLTKADGLGGDDVLQRAALGAGEDGLVDLFGERLLAQDQAASWAAQRLVGGGGDHVRVRNRVLVQSCGDQARNVRHVDKQVSADLVGDLGEFIKADLARVSGSARNDHLRFMLKGQFTNLVVVDALAVVQAVWDEVVVGAGDVDRAAVGQVSAMGKV